MLLCAGNNEFIKGALPIGVGLIESAINLTRLSLMHPPQFLLFVGTAGSYGKAKIFDIIESKSAANIEHSFLLKSAYTPLNNFITTAEDVSHETIVNSSNYITASKKLSEQFLQLNLSIENMEFFSVMRVAKEFNIPCGGVFVITNYCYEDAHKEFKKNQKKALLILEDFLSGKGLIQ